MKISVIVPVYNAERHIEKCVDSILRQTYPNIELILVDDGSSDSSLEVCKQLQDKDPRIKVFTKVNGGPSSARKFGVQNATGEYINFVDSDDTIPLDSLQLLFSKAKEFDLDITQGARNFIPFDGKENKLSDFKEERILNKNQYINSLFSGEANAGPWGSLFKRSLFDENTFNLPDDVRTGEDFYMNLCLGLKSSKIGFYNFIVYDYKENPVSATHNYKFCSIAPQKHLLEAIKRELVKNDLFKEFSSQYYSKAISTLCSACFHNKALLNNPYCLLIANESKHIDLPKNITFLSFMLKYPSLYYLFLYTNKFRQFYNKHF